jgi:hypothetical protein
MKVHISGVTETHIIGGRYPVGYGDEGQYHGGGEGCGEEHMDRPWGMGYGEGDGNGYGSGHEPSLFLNIKEETIYLYEEEI